MTREITFALLIFEHCVAAKPLTRFYCKDDVPWETLQKIWPGSISNSDLRRRNQNAKAML